MWIYRYTLMPRRSLSPLAGARPREGALLRAGDGYADIHPWPELGDAPLDEQLARLAAGDPTPLLRRSLQCAELDARARAERRSLFDGLTIPPSHWPGDDPSPGFDTVKLKSIDRIPPNVRLRIDFNARLTPEQFLYMAEALPRERVDFVEDPCPYDAATWSALRQTTGLRFALDRVSECGGVPPLSSVDVLVIKPAIEEVPRDEREIIITSYMDHPIGQFFAAYIATGFKGTHGLFTHVLYEPNEFTDAVRTDGARLLPPLGTGIGFDDLLEKLPWKKVA
jgi:o-succinylbenzoate synthase